MSDQAGGERELSSGLEPHLIDALRDLGEEAAEASRRLQAARAQPSDAQLAAIVSTMSKREG